MAKSSAITRAEEARANAAAQFAKAKQDEAAVWRERTKRREADAEKTARLRALRLKKEAADKEAAATAPKPAVTRKRLVAKAPAPQDNS
jgi:hypothetical protein